MQPAGAERAAEFEQVALEVARRAAALVLTGFGRPHAVRVKDGNEPVTEWDVSSEELVRRELARLTPEIPVVGEELGGGSAEVLGAPLTWYCDPIDGTVNFMRGNPFFAVSIGVSAGAAPLAGAVVAPALGIEWHGNVVSGSQRNGERCSVSSTADISQAVVSVGNLQSLERLAPRVRALRFAGSAAIELCMVGDGTYDAYWSPALQPWDTCAAAAIVLGAGGTWERRMIAGAARDFGCNRALYATIAATLGSG
jgi:myo-inositol-1(or 4)-monophosphatase